MKYKMRDNVSSGSLLSVFPDGQVGVYQQGDDFVIGVAARDLTYGETIDVKHRQNTSDVITTSFPKD